MLVLGRKIGQAILIPEYNIRIEITQVNHGSARLGITAPRHIEIIREELFVANEAKKAEAEAPAPVESEVVSVS